MSNILEMEKWSLHCNVRDENSVSLILHIITYCDLRDVC